MVDHIEFYNDETLQSWLTDINDYNSKNNTDYIILPHIPFNYNEIARELMRRDNIRDILDFI